MMQRWSNTLTEPLRIFLRRGALLVLGGLAAVILTLSPLSAKPASALGIGDFGLGGNSCAIETVGWVICPTMRSIARLADKGFTYINQSSLSINYELFGNSGKTFKAWEVMRNVADGLFVIVFLYIIYSYLVGRNGGTYSLKRLLPRLLIAAIAVNVSYYIGVILVDISNIIGDSIWALMKNIYGSGSPVMPLGASANPLNDGNLTKMTAAAVGNTAMVWVLLPPLMAVTITVAVISAATVILIIMRQAVIAALILAAPILIVLYLLPNTERFAGQGMRLFFQLLILYPIIALLLGTGQIVSLAAGSWDGPSVPYGGGTMSIVPDLIAAGAAVVPLLATWFIFKNLSAVMNTAGSKLSASIAGRRGGGGKDDKNARVTGKASAGAATVKNAAGVGNIMGRRQQAFSRNKRHRSLGGSSLTGDDALSADSRAGMANRAGRQGGDALQNSIQGNAGEDPTKKLEELQNARIDSGDADNMNIEGAVAAAVANGQAGKEAEKQKTAKDIFNNLNRGHEAKDKDRKFGAGPGQANGNQNGSAQPTAPSSSYKAPAMAQNGNIVTGSAPAQPVQVIAIPVAVDGAALLGGQQHSGPRPPENMSQPPISGTEEKAKARAQKYLFDSGVDTDDDENKLDILGHHDSPNEPPHTSTHGDSNRKSDD